MQKNTKMHRIFTLIFAAVLFFCFSMTAVFAEETENEEPFFHFVNTPFKGVTVKLDTYDYDTYYSKITDEHKRLEAKTLQTQYSSRYQLNDFAVDEFTAVLKGGTDVNELKPISGADFKRYNNAGMYYYIENEGRTYVVRPTSTSDFMIYYRNDAGNIVYVFDTEAIDDEKALDEFAEKDDYVTELYRAFNQDKKTRFSSLSYEEKLELLFGKNKMDGLNASHAFYTNNDGLFYLFDGDWADFEHIHSDANYTYLKAYTIWEKTDTDKFDTVQEVNTDRMIPSSEDGNEHANQAKYSSVYKNTDYLSSQSDFSIDKEGLTTLYINEYVGLSEDELQITKQVPYWGTHSDPTGDSFTFKVYIGDEDISGSEDYSYYITPQEDMTDLEVKATAKSTKNAEFKLKTNQKLHIIGLIDGQSVKIKEFSASGYGFITDENMKYTETDGYYTELEYDKTSNFQRTFKNYPLALSLLKNVTNPTGNEEVVDGSVFTFQLCKQITVGTDTTLVPLTEAEMKKLKGYLLESSTAATFQTLAFSGASGNEFILKDGQRVIITGVEADTIYAAKEISCEIDGVKRDNSYTKGNNGITILKSAAISDTSSPTYLSGSSAGKQDNTYNPQSGLTVSKQVTNDYNNLAGSKAEYLFRIESKNGDTFSAMEVAYKLNGLEKNPATGAPYKTTANGYFTLKANEYAFFSIYQTGEYRITEVNPNKKIDDLNAINTGRETYYTNSNCTNPTAFEKLFTTDCIVDGGTAQQIYQEDTPINTDIPVTVDIIGNKEQSAAFTNRVIDHEYAFNIEKIIYRDKNLHGETDDNEQRFLFKIERFDIKENLNALPDQPIETFYVTMNCPNQVNYNNQKFYIQNKEFDLPTFAPDGTTSFDRASQKITKTYTRTDTNALEQYTYPAVIWQGITNVTVNRKGIYKVSEVTSWSATDYDYCSGSNTFKGEQSEHAPEKYSDKSVSGNTDYVAFIVDDDTSKIASFSNAESEFSYFSSSAYAVNKFQSLQNP